MVSCLGAPSPADRPALGADFPRKRKRSRWNQDSLEQKTVIPGMPTVIPPGLTREQERAYIGNGAAAGRAGGSGAFGGGTERTRGAKGRLERILKGKEQVLR